MSKARFPIGKVTTSYDGCGGALLREREGAFHCINSYSRSFWIRRPPLRFSAGAPGEKTRGLWDCGIVAKSRFLKFPDFSCFSLFEKWPKFHFSKVPPFGLAPEIRIFWFPAPNQRGGPLKSEILAIFQIRKNMKNPEISEIAIFAKSLNP